MTTTDSTIRSATADAITSEQRRRNEMPADPTSPAASEAYARQRFLHPTARVVIHDALAGNSRSLETLIELAYARGAHDQYCASLRVRS